MNGTSSPIFNLASSLVARAEQNMPGPVPAESRDTANAGPGDDDTRQILPGMPIMDEEDALEMDLMIQRKIADGAIQTAKAEKERADRLHAVCATALLLLAQREPRLAQEKLENALDAELQPKPDLGPVPF